MASHGGPAVREQRRERQHRRQKQSQQAPQRRPVLDADRCTIAMPRNVAQRVIGKRQQRERERRRVKPPGENGRRDITRGLRASLPSALPPAAEVRRPRRTPARWSARTVSRSWRDRRAAEKSRAALPMSRGRERDLVSQQQWRDHEQARCLDSEHRQVHHPVGQPSVQQQEAVVERRAECCGRPSRSS